MTPRTRLYICIEAANHGVTINQVVGESRSSAAVRARWAVMRRLSRDGFSTVQIGRWLNRDHTTVVHGLKRGSA